MNSFSDNFFIIKFNTMYKYWYNKNIIFQSNTVKGNKSINKIILNKPKIDFFTSFSPTIFPFSLKFLIFNNPRVFYIFIFVSRIEPFRKMLSANFINTLYTQQENVRTIPAEHHFNISIRSVIREKFSIYFSSLSLANWLGSRSGAIVFCTWIWVEWRGGQSRGW